MQTGWAFLSLLNYTAPAPGSRTPRPCALAVCSPGFSRSHLLPAQLSNCLFPSAVIASLRFHQTSALSFRFSAFGFLSVFGHRSSASPPPIRVPSCNSRNSVRFYFRISPFGIRSSSFGFPFSSAFDSRLCGPHQTSAIPFRFSAFGFRSTSGHRSSASPSSNSRPFA
jgi:hypothetical protein